VKIALASDIHLEFADLILKNEENAEVLILSGDICTVKVFKHKPKERMKVKDFFKRCSFQFPHVVYIMGNHEHYDFDIAKTYDRLKVELADLPNIHVLEKETWEHNGVTFVAGTLWTDMNKGDPLTMWHCGKAMNDFQLIKNGNRGISGGGYISRWAVEDSVEDHKKMLDFINIVTQDKSKCYVVVTHHAPTPLSIHSHYKNDYLMNGAFASDLSEFIMDRPQIKLWTHGHMHNVSDYLVYETRVVCNPRGYHGYEQRAKEFKLRYLEI
jgi:Icc-related predicted phosphoesterase